MSLHSRATDRRSASKCQGKWPDQTLDQAFGLPEVLVAVSTSRLSCKRAGKTRTLMPVWDSSGESRLKAFVGKEPPPNYLADRSQVVFDDPGGAGLPGDSLSVFLLVGACGRGGEAAYIEECLVLLCKMSQRAMGSFE